MDSRFRRGLAPLAAFLTAGCAGPSPEALWPEPRPLGGDLPAYEAPADPPETDAPDREIDREPDGPLPLRQALALALLHNPKLASTSWTVRMREARAMYAGSWPNPELEAEISEFAGSGGREGFDTAEMTIRLSQLIELGGQRSARIQIAEAEGRLAGWDYEAERLAVLTDVTLAFVDALAAQERGQLARELVRLSGKVLATVTTRVDAGKGAPLEKAKALIELSNNRILLANIESELRVARKRLAATWGSTAPAFAQTLGSLDRVSDIPDFARVRELLEQNPGIARWTQEMERQLAVLQLERARRVPDLTVGVGYQRFLEADENAMTLGFSLPLPLFDTNQGGIREARHRLARLGRDRESAGVRIATVLAESYESLTAARAEAITLKKEVLPAATQVFEAAQAGYQGGRLGYLEVLDAQRTLFETRGRLLEALSRYHQSVAVVESLIGTRLETLGVK